ncbi:MAG: ABC transporter ATP-binding protein [archaeon]|nr:ABC transporter ATP-binding protein [archaeon]MCP8321400.1 ABC transporter ATP-binding protein [archaeon]
MVNIEIEGVHFNYKSIKALESLTAKIESGSFVGLLGPNGSGKTTLLKCLSGLLKPRIGSIYFDGKKLEILSGNELAKNFSIVLTNAIDTPQMEVFDIVATARHPWTGWLGSLSTKDINSINEALEILDIKDLVTRRFNELSDGQKQKVLIARALAQEARVLLLDEPVAHLDIKHQVEVLGLIKRITKEKDLITIGALHDVNLASLFCDSAILLSEGRIVSIGPIDTVLTDENIERVFHVSAIVKKHPITNSLYVVPLCTPELKSVQPRALKVHIICGGGTGASLMRILLEHGYKISVGVLNVLDTDYEVACTLGIPVVSEAPFSSITEEVHKTNLNKIGNANVVILTDAPFGRGNLKNLGGAMMALEKGITTIVVEEKPIQERDFTGGYAQASYMELRRRGAIFVESYGRILPILEKLEEKQELVHKA